MPPRLLVTRPEEDAGRLATALVAMGIEPVLAPMIDVAFLDRPEPDLVDVQALLVTSANGARAFARLSARRDLPVLAVGDASAAEARRLGFGAVRSASGTVADLARLTEQAASRDGGPLLHVAGTAVAGDLSGLLAAAGFACRREVLYDVRPATSLPDAARAALAGHAVEGGVFFSPRTAAAFVAALRGDGLSGACGGLTVFGLSTAVADALAGVEWRAVRVAERPNQESLLALIGRTFGRRVEG